MEDNSGLNICVILGPSHLEVGRITINRLFKLYGKTNIFVISSLTTFYELGVGVNFINEDNLIVKKKFENLYFSLFNSFNRNSWYYQQFLKMKLCDVFPMRYVVWDSDTIPINHIDFFDGDRIMFNRKPEHHQPYFDCIHRLFPSVNVEQRSFISEYMPILSTYMGEMISKIGGDDKWIENILMSINKEDVFGSGFSEYETYGNYMSAFHKTNTSNITLNTLRNGFSIFKTIPSEKDIENNHISYDTISFENWMK